MDLDALLLSRLQFAFTIAFHIIFPSFTIGLASYLAVLEGLWLITRNALFKPMEKAMFARMLRTVARLRRTA